MKISGVSSLGVPGMPWHPQILADQLTLSQPDGADYAHQIILAPPDFLTIEQGIFIALRELVAKANKVCVCLKKRTLTLFPWYGNSFLG